MIQWTRVTSLSYASRDGRFTIVGRTSHRSRPRKWTLRDRHAPANSEWAYIGTSLEAAKQKAEGIALESSEVAK